MIDQDIKDSMKAVLSVKEHSKKLESYAREMFADYFKHSPTQDGCWRKFDKYEIYSENILRVKYSYGAGDMEYSEFFDIVCKQ